ncbi:Uncharacterized protein TCM_013011 [Theobroma cacao]|uniref:Uncharacterized protein n=1 Tax=Theobroma cacao TaxID=3641 RepID=A0A061FV77_THECC|nr:Uncharacterized protein TCM_013011 [Theobroma cacao]
MWGVPDQSTPLQPCHGNNKCKHVTNEFYSNYYKTWSWVEGYAVPIHPVRHPNDWEISPDVKQIAFCQYLGKVKQKDLKRRRIPSIEEDSR